MIILVYMAFNLSCLRIACGTGEASSTSCCTGVIPLLGILAWFMLGVPVLVYCCTRHPERLPLMRRVFADEPAASEEPQVAAGVQPTW